MYDRVKFFRRRQFVLGSEYIDYDGWKRLKVVDTCLLTVHPDLQITVVEQDENKAVLLGYAIDPYQPELNDQDTLRRFVDGPISQNEICGGLEALTGRFVLIVKSGTSLWLFHDACGLRQVNYCFDQDNAMWCASQPETLAERFGFKYDEEMLSYRNMAAFQSGKEEFWFTNDRTPYRGIKYLLPNHYLDLRTGGTQRYWPITGCIGSISVKESINLCKPVLQNSINAAAQRFDLKMGISAGCDSRKSLAAAKNVKNKIYFFTHTPTPSKKVDMEIPARLLPKLGVEHHKIDLQKMNNEFQGYYECSASWAREKHGHIAYTALNHFGTEATVLNSNISEFSQVYYWLPKSRINGEGLAVVTGLNHSLALCEFDKWLEGAKNACESAKINLLVLFDLELRSRWIAAAISEYDITYETFNPYNNRHLFCLELSVNERHRKGRRLDFHMKQIKNMWPEVLMEPINPKKRLLGKIRDFILHTLIQKTVSPWLPVVEYLRYLKLKQKFERKAHVRVRGCS